MATTVTVIQDIELESTIKVVADGAGGGAATIDINALSGAAAANNLVAITGIKSSCVTHSDAAAAGYTWGLAAIRRKWETDVQIGKKYGSQRQALEILQ